MCKAKIKFSGTSPKNFLNNAHYTRYYYYIIPSFIIFNMK